MFLPCGLYAPRGDALDRLVITDGKIKLSPTGDSSQLVIKVRAVVGTSLSLMALEGHTEKET